MRRRRIIKHDAALRNLSVSGRFPSISLDGIMEENEILERLAMKKRLKEAMLRHDRPVYQLKTGYFVTHVYDPTRPDKKRKVQKSTEEKLWLFLADWYENGGKRATLATVYPEWLEEKKTPSNQANIKRIEAAWKSYYADELLSRGIINTPLDELKPKELTKWAAELIRKNSPVDIKKFNRMFSILNGCLEYAIYFEEYGIATNVWQVARKRLNTGLLAKPATPLDCEQVFTDEERKKLTEMVYADLMKYPEQSSSAGLQILLILETALRRGEACGLKWSDIRNGRLAIQRQANNEGVKEWTKTAAGRREIPLTKRAVKILDDVAAFNAERGYDKEWIFQSGSPEYDYRLSYNAAEKKLLKLCKRLGTPDKSLHKLRKTVLSTLLDNPDVNNRTVQRFAGHSDIRTTESFYNFERRSLDEQAAAIDRALEI